MDEGFRLKMRRLIVESEELSYRQKARLFDLMIWSGPGAAWHEYNEMVATPPLSAEARWGLQPRASAGS